MKDALEQLQRGELSFNQFARKTHQDWVKLAAHLVRKFHPKGARRLPASADVEDVRQELLTTAWEYVKRWRPDGGQPLHRYVVHAACDKATRYLNTQRNACRRSSSAPSRIPTHIHDHRARLGREDWLESEWDCVVYVEAVQDRVLEAREAAEAALDRAPTRRAKLCLVALIESAGDLEESAERLYRDPRKRLAGRFDNKEEIKRAIQRAVHISCGEIIRRNEFQASEDDEYDDSFLDDVPAVELDECT